jgi:peroxiredoxin Q/BCP
MLGNGVAVGRKAPDFVLKDHQGKSVRLSEEYSKGPVMLVFYPGDFTPICTKQLCTYRDNLVAFEELGIQILGISVNGRERHEEFVTKYRFPFRLLSDDRHVVSKLFECTSFLMLGKVSRAVVIVNNQGMVLYRYVEPTTLTHRKADELLKILQDLSKNKLLNR